MTFEDLRPEDIEKKSMQMIESELKAPLDPLLAPIIKRVIHTTADFDYADNLYFSAKAYETAMDVFKSKVTIVTDTNMALAGINKPALAKLGGQAFCYMADEDVAKEAAQRGVTRATVSMERAAELEGNVILAVGNAPTALIKADELMKKGEFHPKLIIGVPVGFVNVVAAKELIIESGCECIIARGRKGGSNVAAAIINALMYILTR